MICMSEIIPAFALVVSGFIIGFVIGLIFNLLIKKKEVKKK